MCVIIHVPAKKDNVSKETLQKCFNTNPHGWGIMWAENSKLFTVKSTGNFKHFYKTWKDVPIHSDRAIHFRIKTSGLINNLNCHPFRIGADLGLMHNGVINTPLIDGQFSDTHNFSRYELPPLVSAWPNFMDDPEFVDLMDEMTGYSKLLFMNNEGKVLITRKRAWTLREGCNFSNTNGLHYVSTHSSYGGANSSFYDEHNKNVAARRAADKQLDNSCWNPEVAARNKYKALNPPKHSDIKSDLYSGNRTDEEGQDHLDRLEEARQQAIQNDYEFNLGHEEDEVLDRRVQALLENQGKGNFPRSLVGEAAEEIEEDDVDALENDPGIVIEADDLEALDFAKTLEFVQDMPRSAALTIQYLIQSIRELELAMEDKTKQVSA